MSTAKIMFSSIYDSNHKMDLQCSLSPQQGKSYNIEVTWNSPGECAYYFIAWTGLFLFARDVEPDSGSIELRVDNFIIIDALPDSNCTIVQTT